MSKALVMAMCFFAMAMADGIEVVHFNEAEKETRYFNLINEMRCLVCQNQTLADSNAPLAKDMRAVIRQMLKDGAADKEVIAFVVERYGDFVLYRPPFSWQTAVLWVAPFLFVVVTILLAWRLVSHRRVSLDKHDREAAQRLLRE